MLFSSGFWTTFQTCVCPIKRLFLSHRNSSVSLCSTLLMQTSSSRPSKILPLSEPAWISVLGCCSITFFFFCMCVPVRVILNTENSLDSSLQDSDEDEVWLYWIDQNKEPHGKSIRNMSEDAKNQHKEDMDHMTYYRSGFLFSSPVFHCLLPFYLTPTLKVQFVMFKCISRPVSCIQFANRNTLVNSAM